MSRRRLVDAQRVCASTTVTVRHSSVFLLWRLWFMEEPPCCKNLRKITHFCRKRGGESTLLCHPCFSNTPTVLKLILFQFLFIVLTGSKRKAMLDGYLFFFSPLCPFLFFPKWVIVKQFMYSLSACVFIGGSELGLKPSPQVVFETWKEAPIAHTDTLHHPLSLLLPLSFYFSLSLTHNVALSLGVSVVVTLWRRYLHFISYYFIGSQSCQKTPSWNIQQA